MTKGLKLDSESKTITEVEIGDYTDYYTHLNCQCFAVVNIGPGIDMYIDDEGLLKNAYIDDDGVKHNMTGIQITNYPQLLMGNGVIVGTNDDGESIDCPVSIAQVESIMTFVELDNPNDKPEPAMGFIAWGDSFFDNSDLFLEKPLKL